MLRILLLSLVSLSFTSVLAADYVKGEGRFYSTKEDLSLIHI